MSASGFDTPEQAAMLGFPPAHVRVVAVAQDGNDAFVVLDTGSPGTPYLYGGTVHRIAGKWEGGSDHNGGGVGWTVTDSDQELGVVTIWDEAPVGAEAARVRWRSVERAVPVNAGGFLAAWWREPYPEDEWPTLVAFRVSGQWITPIRS
jgi:hypothetical protein